MPLYANTHTESSGTGLQTSRFREDARDIIRAAMGAPREEYAVIFCGSGSTAAVDKLVGILNLRIPADLDRRYDLRAHIPPGDRPVVFIGPFEHHSNELPWRESIADVVTIREDRDGHVDLEHLAEELERHADRPLRIGSFSAASNVTGIHSDTRAISVLLHQHGALALWDYGAAAPYLEMNMTSRRPAPDGDTTTASLDYKDAAFISPHKFIGGPGTPGLLVARRALLTNSVPTVPGGGTVAYVNPLEHVYLDDPEHREEGGTPAIIESIRAGLVFQLKQQVGAEAIRAREEDFIDRALAAWTQVPGLEILGDLARAAAVHRQLRHPPRRPLPAPRLRGGAPQRPLRHPVARRLLLRRALRPSSPGHRPRDVTRVRARDHPWLRGHQARLGARQLQLLHQRDGLPLHPRGRRAGGPTRLAAPAALPLRARHRSLASRRRPGGGAALAARRALRGERHALRDPPPPGARIAAGRLPGRGPRAAGSSPGPDHATAGHGRPGRGPRLRGPALVPHAGRGSRRAGRRAGGRERGRVSPSRCQLARRPRRQPARYQTGQ